MTRRSTLLTPTKARRLVGKVLKKAEVEVGSELHHGVFYDLKALVFEDGSRLVFDVHEREDDYAIEALLLEATGRSA